MPWLISPTNVPPVAQQVHELIFLELMCRSKSTVIEAEKYLLEVILEMEWVFVFCIDATLFPYLLSLTFRSLVLPGANIFSRVGFKLTNLAGFRFSLDVIHMVADYLVSLRIEDHQAFSPFGVRFTYCCNCDVT